jgi:tRNA(Arg) A34 adenosine deaminase TadA
MGEETGRLTAGARFNAMPDFDDERWLRRAIWLAENSGDQPFGAVLVGPDGTAWLESGQTVESRGERLGHAELNVLLEAGQRWTLAESAACTLYSSTEPCPMCTGAIAWSVNRLTYGLSQARMYELWPADVRPRFSEPWSCRTLLERLHPPMEVIGPMLEDEAAVAHMRAAERSIKNDAALGGER